METLGTCENKIYDNKETDNFLSLFYGEISNRLVLDIGCGTGHLGAYLARRNNQVFGITLSELEAIKARERLSKVLVEDIEQAQTLPYPKKHFDVVIFADSLEHFRSPEAILNKIRPYLKDDALLITSIPNIANFKIRFGLMFGRFNYEKDGILDNTHLRFFTLKTAKELISNAGFLVEQVKFTNWNWQFPKSVRRLIDFCEWEIRHKITKLRPTFFATQFVIYARNVPSG